jgi:hypothetical protein
VLALKKKKKTSGQRDFTTADNTELKGLQKITKVNRGPGYCAEPEVFLPMRRKCSRDAATNRKLSVLALAEIKGKDIQIKEFCGIFLFAKNVIEGDWKEIIDVGEGREGEWLRIPTSIAV